MPASVSNPIILYDGVCGLCNRLVQFVLKHDSQDRFRFAALQSDFAVRVLAAARRRSREISTPCTWCWIPACRESAWLPGPTPRLSFCRTLGGGWAAFGMALGVLPGWLRNWGYNLVARNRYRTFGKYVSCPIPEERHRRKFLDQQ